jgi:microcystin-dependent protein
MEIKMKAQNQFRHSLVFLAAMLFSLPLRAEVPDLMHYQGTLFDSQGTAINQADATLTFNVYSVAESDPEINRIWGPQTFNGVSIVGGRFNVALGGDDEDAPSRNLAQQLKDGDAYIEITVGEGQQAQVIAPRQKLESVPYALQARYSLNDGVPAGTIIMWGRSEIPDGWAVCDGTNDTPDLENRFIVSTGNKYSLGAQGGEALVTLSVGQMPSHSHSGNVSNGGYSFEHHQSNGRFPGQYWSTSSGNTGSSQAHENRPPYYALRFLMKL